MGWIWVVALLLAAGMVHSASAGDAELRLAAEDYARSCQGCHLVDGRGVPGAVPALAGFTGYFLHLEEGREFLARVPGVAMAPLGDERLATVLNWTLLTFSRAELPRPFVPYTAREVAVLRAEPLTNVTETRRRLIAQLQASGVLESNAQGGL